MCWQAALNANDVCYHKDDQEQADCDRLYVIETNSQNQSKISPPSIAHSLLLKHISWKELVYKPYTRHLTNIRWYSIRVNIF